MKILMTKGNGGGTVATTAIYNGIPEIINETLKIDDVLTAFKINTEFIDKVEAMTDVTNGGIRGDALEISEMSNLSFIIDQEKFLSLINKKVLDMFNSLEIDPLGVSIDSLLIFTQYDDLEKELNKEGLEVKTIGYVDEYKGYPILTTEGKKLEPNFRESPYTPIKKIIGNYSPYTLDEIKRYLEKAYNNAIAKKQEVLKNLKVTFT
jgi:hydrogenase expression/formation protein